MIERLINTGILLIACSLVWSPITDLAEGPFNWLGFFFGMGIFCMVKDLADYQRSLTLRSLSYGLLLGPLWLILRPITMSKRKGA